MLLTKKELIKELAKNFVKIKIEMWQGGGGGAGGSGWREMVQNIGATVDGMYSDHIVKLKPLLNG